MSPDNTVLILEALLFAAPEPLSVEDIRTRLPEGADVSALLARLQQDYAGRGIRLGETGGKWAFRTAPEWAEYLRLEKQSERPLSRAALETMAIIAYHQPVTRAEIEQIRGVSTGKGTLDMLMEAGFIKPGRRREIPGRPLTWLTTPHFLNHFNLAGVQDLPGLDELKSAGLLDRRPAIDTVPETGNMFENDTEEED